MGESVAVLPAWLKAISHPANASRPGFGGEGLVCLVRTFHRSGEDAVFQQGANSVGDRARKGW